MARRSCDWPYSCRSRRACAGVGVAALTRYRAWGPWRFFISGGIIGGLVAVVVFFVAHLSTLAPWAQVAYLLLSVLGPLAWTGAALGIGRALRRAGVARR